MGQVDLMIPVPCGYAARPEYGSHKASYVELDLREPSTTASDRPSRNRPTPYACYAEGSVAAKEKAHFEVVASLEALITPMTAASNLTG